MYFFKRLCCLIFIFLLVISVYKDLSTGTSMMTEKDETAIEISEENSQTMKVVKIKVTSGDNALSIIERVNNDHLSKLDIDKFLEDFTKLNPHANPSSLKVNEYYYFPLY